MDHLLWVITLMTEDGTGVALTGYAGQEVHTCHRNGSGLLSGLGIVGQLDVNFCEGQYHKHFAQLAAGF